MLLPCSLLGYRIIVAYDLAWSLIVSRCQFLSSDVLTCRDCSSYVAVLWFGVRPQPVFDVYCVRVCSANNEGFPRFCGKFPQEASPKTCKYRL